MLRVVFGVSLYFLSLVVGGERWNEETQYDKIERRKHKVILTCVIGVILHFECSMPTFWVILFNE